MSFRGFVLMREVIRTKPGQIWLSRVVGGEIGSKVPPAILLCSLALSLLTACQTAIYDPRIDSACWDPPSTFSGEYDGQIHLNQVEPEQVMIECEEFGLLFPTSGLLRPHKIQCFP